MLLLGPLSNGDYLVKWGNKQMPKKVDIIIFAVRSVWRPGQDCQGLTKTTDESTTDCALQDAEIIAAV